MRVYCKSCQSEQPAHVHIPGDSWPARCHRCGGHRVEAVGERAITMASGLHISATLVTVDQIDLLDLALGISLEHRFRGQTERPLSVLEHVYRVAAIVEVLGGGLRSKLAALLHDAHEAWLGDCPGPFKTDDRRRLEEMGDRAIYRHLELDINEFEQAIGVVTVADRVALAVEHNAFHPAPPDAGIAAALESIPATALAAGCTVEALHETADLSLPATRDVCSMWVDDVRDLARAVQAMGDAS